MKKQFLGMVFFALAGVTATYVSGMNVCKSPYYDNDGYNLQGTITTKLTKEEKKYLETILKAHQSMLKMFTLDTNKEVRLSSVSWLESLVKKNGEGYLFKYKKTPHYFTQFPGQKKVEYLPMNVNFLTFAFNTGDLELINYLLLPHFHNKINLKNILINCPTSLADLDTPLLRALKFDLDGRTEKIRGLKGESNLWLKMMQILVKNGAVVNEDFMRKQLGRDTITLIRDKKTNEIIEVTFTGQSNVKILHDRLTKFLKWYKSSPTLTNIFGSSLKKKKKFFDMEIILK
jgi:hypothetical protein